MLLATVGKMENATCDEGEELFGLLGDFSYLFPIPQYILLQLQRQHPDFSPMRKKKNLSGEWCLFWIFLITTFKMFQGDQTFTKKCFKVLSNVKVLEKPMICFAEKA